MDEILDWIAARGRLPGERSTDRAERSMARWLYLRRREAADGTLAPAYREGLARAPGWRANRRETEDDTRWHDRLAQLVAFREEGNDWPRHRKADSDREHALGVWIHTQRYKRRRGDLDPAKIKLLDAAVPGWQAGRKRGRPRRDMTGSQRPMLRSGA